METITDHITRIHDRIKRAVPGFTGIHFATKSNGEMFGYMHTEGCCQGFDSIAKLKAIIQTYKPYEHMQTRYCVSGKHKYAYQIGPEDRWVELVGGIPLDEKKVVQVKADCLAHYDLEMEKKVENNAENIGQDIELRRLG